MSKSKKIQFLAKVQECCKAASDNDGAAVTKLESLAQTYAQEHNIPLHETFQLKDERKRTPLHYACRARSSDKESLLTFLLASFPDAESLAAALKIKDKDGLTCLMVAVQSLDPLVAERRTLLILEKAGRGSKSGLVRSKAGATALHYAAGAGATATTIRTLWENGKVALKTFALQGGTPLHWACSSSKDVTVTIQTLVKCGAEVNASREASDSETAVPPPLALALAVGNDSNACTLLESPDIVVDTFLSGGKRTLFHLAAQKNLHCALKMMLAKLSHLEFLLQKDKDGLTALDVAEKIKSTECVELLRPAAPADETVSHANTKESPKSATSSDPEGETTTANVNASTIEETRALEIWRELQAMSTVPDEKAQAALECKAQGNSHFQRSEWQLAIDCYTQAIEANPRDPTFYANRSACLLQLGNASAALTDATLARLLKPKWTKAYYRRAMALLELERHQDAALAAYEGLQIEPSNTELQRLLRTCISKGRSAHQKSKQGQEEESKATTD